LIAASGDLAWDFSCNTCAALVELVVRPVTVGAMRTSPARGVSIAPYLPAPLKAPSALAIGALAGEQVVVPITDGGAAGAHGGRSEGKDELKAEFGVVPKPLAAGNPKLVVSAGVLKGQPNELEGAAGAEIVERAEAELGLEAANGGAAAGALGAAFAAAAPSAAASSCEMTF